MEKKSPFIFDTTTIGFAIYLTLSSTSAWGLLWLASMPSASFGGINGTETWRSLGFIGALAVFGLGCLFFPGLFKRNTAIPSALCFSLGFAGMFTSMAIPNESLRTSAAFLIGLGSALSFIVWMRLLAEEKDGRTVQRIIWGSVISAALYLLIANITPLWFYTATVFLFIAMNAVLQTRCCGTTFTRPPASLVVGKDGKDALLNIISSTWRYMFCIASIGYASGMTRILVQQSGGSSFSVSVSMGIGMLLATGALAFVWAKAAKHLAFSMVYTVLFFVVMTGFLFLPFFGIEYRLFFAGLANAAFSVASIFMMVTCIRVAALRQIDPVGVFGVFASIVYGSVLVGRAIGDVASQFYDISQILVIVLMSIYVLSFAEMIINFKRKARETDLDVADTTSAHGNEDRSSYEPAVPPQPLIRNVVVAQDMVPVYSRMIKKAYGLSNRETDVLELIIRGRDVARMAETLFVSENTVRSHCKNLYRKLDVHNRQQVFDLVEEFSQREEIDHV